ncbi:MAG: MlaD family protein [Nitrospirota bacterium]
MPREKTSKFMIGLFVVLGVAIGAGTIVWIGASRYFEEGRKYAAYFDESVQGLRVDSPVKYRGVEVGRVNAIRISPDNRLVEVVMTVNLQGDLTKDTVAQLAPVGITGLVFIELDRRKRGEELEVSKITFPTEQPMIPTRRSEREKLKAEAERILSELRQIDLVGVSRQFKETALAVEEFLSNKQMKRMVSNLENTSAQLDRTMTAIGDAVEQGKVAAVLDETHATLSDARTLIAEARKEMAALKLGQTSEEARDLVEGLRQRTGAISSDMTITAENLRRASQRLERLLMELSQDPSALIFGEQPPPARQREQ